MVDKRMLHTRYFLRNALIELMKTKTINEITITELCKTANINRNTFYAHFSTPEDVLNEIESSLLKGIEEILCEESDEQKLYGLYSHFKENKELYKVFIKNRSSRLSEKMLELCEESNIYRSKYFDEENHRLSKLFYIYSSAGSIQIVNEWILNDCIMPIEELQKIIDSFALYGLSAFKAK